LHHLNDLALPPGDNTELQATDSCELSEHPFKFGRLALTASHRITDSTPLD
jgi:hypothetical protein